MKDSIIEWSADSTGFTVTVTRQGVVVEQQHHGNCLSDATLDLPADDPNAMSIAAIRVLASMAAYDLAEAYALNVREMQLGS